MKEWKSTEWKEKLKRKPVRYWIRDEIEEIIKEENIDRNRFYEFSKSDYSNIINRFYYTFANYEQYPNVELSYCWLHFRENLKKTNVVRECDYNEWADFLQRLQSLIPQTVDEKSYMILSEGWVYEGYADEIFCVLKETDGLLEDFYIVSIKFDWFIAYCTDGECSVMYWK